MQLCPAVIHELQLRTARSPSSVSSMRPMWLQWCLSSRLRAAHCSAERLQYSPSCRGRRGRGLVGDSDRGRSLVFVLPLGRSLLRLTAGLSSVSGVGMPPIIWCVARGSGEPLGVLGTPRVAGCSPWSHTPSGGSSSGAELGTIIHDPNIPRQANFLPLGGFLCPLHLSHFSAGTSSSASSEYDGYLTFGSLVNGFLPSPEPPPSPSHPDCSFDSLQLHIFGFFFLLLRPGWVGGPVTARNPFVLRSGVVGCACDPRIGSLSAAIFSRLSWNFSVD
jgi:hypothetical protein